MCGEPLPEYRCFHQPEPACCRSRLRDDDVAAVAVAAAIVIVHRDAQRLDPRRRIDGVDRVDASNGNVPNGLGSGSGALPSLKCTLTSPTLHVKVRSSAPWRSPPVRRRGQLAARFDDLVVAAGEADRAAPSTLTAGSRFATLPPPRPAPRTAVVIGDRHGNRVRAVVAVDDVRRRLLPARRSITDLACAGEPSPTGSRQCACPACPGRRRSR